MWLWCIYFYLREINVCENTQDKNAYENENIQGKNLLHYDIFFFIAFSNIQPSDRNALLWIAVTLLSALDCKLCQGT